MLEKAAWLMFIIFFCLKVAGVTDMSWFYVVLPLIVNYLIALLAIGIVLFAGWRERRRSKSWIDRLMR